MNFSNQLISSDNKGAASMITEMYFNGDTAPIGQVGILGLPDLATNFNTCTTMPIVIFLKRLIFLS